MEDSSKSSTETKPALWQERLSRDADWIHSKIWNGRNQVENLKHREITHQREIYAAIPYSIFGIAAGAGLAAIESIVEKKPVALMRCASYAGGLGLGLALLGIILSTDKDRNKTSDSEACEVEYLNSIRNLLAEAYGEEALKGRHQWYEQYQKIKNDPILTGDFAFSNSR